LLSLTEDLLGLAAAQAFGGAEAVVSALAARLAVEAPFSSGEVALTTGAAWRGWPLREGDHCVAGDELLEWLCGRGHLLRVDDPAWLPLPRTRARLVERGYSSMLASPFGGAGAARGALILYHRRRWAFSAVSVRWLEPLTAMLGHCMRGALRQEELQRENQRLRAQPLPSVSGEALDGD
jgi:hypothetical protein